MKYGRVLPIVSLGFLLLASACNKGPNGLRLGDVYGFGKTAVYVFKKNTADFYVLNGYDRSALQKIGFDYRPSGDDLWVLILKDVPVEYTNSSIKIIRSSCIKGTACGTYTLDNSDEILEIKNDGLVLEGEISYKNMKPENEFFTSELKSVPPDPSQ